MTDQKTIKNKFSSRAPAGEPFVWLTALGLSLGLLMIISVLLLIIYQGITAFLPREIVQITVTEKSQTMISGSKTFSGEIIKKQTKKMVSPTSDEKQPKREWQLFVGNKDVYGFSFFYIDVDDIKSVDKPKDIMTIEREEYGRAWCIR